LSPTIETQQIDGDSEMTHLYCAPVLCTCTARPACAPVLRACTVRPTCAPGLFDSARDYLMFYYKYVSAQPIHCRWGQNARVPAAIPATDRLAFGRKHSTLALHWHWHKYKNQ